MTRQSKTPQQRAEEALGVAQRRVRKLTAARDKVAAQLKGLDKELADAERRLDYARKDPALPQTPSTKPSTTTPRGDTA